MEKKCANETTEWLVSPVSERARRLQPARDLTVCPYLGRRRSVRLVKSEIMLGSSSACDLRIDDPFVSPSHALLRIENSGFGYSVRDLDSRNGVFLNGVRVTCAPLPSSGTLRIGRSSLIWAEHSDAPAAIEHGWVVADPRMIELMEDIKRAASTRSPVLLLGETGTGKDIIARILHHLGSGQGTPYVPVNCALTGGPLAESELFGHSRGAFTGAESARLGALRSAHGGTLFLDEIADMPAGAQVKLLRALEGGEVKPLGADRTERSEFRLVSATSRNLNARIADGSFRPDLYYRIAGQVLTVPPLRERPRDVTAIARKISLDLGLDLDRAAEERLLCYQWPGNVRELRACVERAGNFALSMGVSRILPDHLMGLNRPLRVSVPEEEGVPQTLAQVERECVEAALVRNGWSRKIAARELGISRSGLYEKMRRHGFMGATAATASIAQ